MSEENKHLAKMFHNKFEAIDEALWCTGVTTDVTGRHCALGHLGETTSTKARAKTNEGKMIHELFCDYFPDSHVTDINDGWNGQFDQSTPKARILAALEDIIRQ